MDLKLDGKRALVTGASSGIGREIAQALAREGATVVVCGRNRERTEETVTMITEAGGKALAAVGDLTSDDDADAIAKTATDALGGIDILVNNAGGGSESGDSALKWHEFTPEKFHRSYDLNLVAVRQFAGQRRNLAVDLGAHGGVADVGVHRIGKVDRRRLARQGDQFALGREAEHLVVEQFELGVLEKFFRV